jgi:polysaccharide biosynthesis/export protein
MKTPWPPLRVFAFPALLILFVSCASPRPDLSGLPPISNESGPSPENQLESAQILADFRKAGEQLNASGYRISPGDDVTVSVFGREDLSGQHRVGPDGYISLPVVGDVLVGGLHRKGLRIAVEEAFANAYADLAVTVGVDRYTAYTVVVLGSVNSPGEYQFDSVPTLLRVIGMAKGLADDANGLKPERCAIMRGKEHLLWIDLNQLLTAGDISLNVELIPGDVIHVTADNTRLVYVLGEVASPGIYPLRSGMTALDAIALAGGITQDANDDGIRVLRPTQGAKDNFDYEEFSEGDFLQNRLLAKGDVVFAPRHTLAEIGWVFTQFSPLVGLGYIYGYTVR